MPKRVYKYATGDSPPEGAVYLNTVTQTHIYDGINDSYRKCWFVWHYFLVEVNDA